MRVILVRVGIDQSCGRWNAPCNPHNRDFVYVPIPEIGCANVRGLEKRYTGEVVPALRSFCERNGCEVSLPRHLRRARMHLDPDFGHLTYGDTAFRGRRLARFAEDDVVIFYAGLRSVTDNELVYALIGKLVVREVVRVGDVTDPGRLDENAHTRRLRPEPTDVVVRGKRNGSGRFTRYIPVGERRDAAYRVERKLLAQWGDLSARDGYIQRSANPPLLCRPARFLAWLQRQEPQVIQANNLQQT